MSRFSTAAARSARDPWLALTSVFGGGVAWAVGLGPVGIAVAAGMFVAGTVVGGLMRGDDDEAAADLPLPDITKGTEQATLVANLSSYVSNLQTMRNQPKPDAVVDPTIEALVAAQNAYGTAVRVAAAVDGLDDALRRSAPAGLPGGGRAEVSDAIRRMAERRQALLAKLHGTVDEVAEVYTKLLEMSATVQALDVGAGATDEVEKVNASLDTLRTSLADLEDQARKPG
jgi:hypothetical protein